MSSLLHLWPFTDWIFPRQLWDLKTHKIRVDLPGHTDEVYCVDFVADKIASGGRDKKVKMYVFLFIHIVRFIFD